MPSPALSLSPRTVFLFSDAHLPLSFTSLLKTLLRWGLSMTRHLSLELGYCQCRTHESIQLLGFLLFLIYLKNSFLLTLALPAMDLFLLSLASLVFFLHVINSNLYWLLSTFPFLIVMLIEINIYSHLTFSCTIYLWCS